MLRLRLPLSVGCKEGAKSIFGARRVNSRCNARGAVPDRVMRRARCQFARLTWTSELRVVPSAWVRVSLRLVVSATAFAEAAVREHVKPLENDEQAHQGAKPERIDKDSGTPEDFDHDRRDSVNYWQKGGGITSGTKARSVFCSPGAQ